MKNEILLSIIIPNYNKGKYLKRCLDSIVNQDLNGVEIIVLDDCSTDDSMTILNDYKNIKLISSQFNRGVCETRNIGIDLAKGKYITFIDSDDFVTEDYMSNIKTSLNTQDDLYIFDVKKYRGKELKREYICCEHGFISIEDYMKNNSKEYLKAHISYWVWNKIFKREVINNNKIYFEKFDCEDEDFCSRYMLCIDHIYFINKKLYNYCVNETSISGRKNICYSNMFKVVATNIFNNFIKFNGNLDLLEKEIIKLFEVGYTYSSSEDDKKKYFYK